MDSKRIKWGHMATGDGLTCLWPWDSKTARCLDQPFEPDETRSTTPFSRVVHGTHFDEAVKISTEGLQPRRVSDVSHYKGEAVWMAGADAGHCRYGNYVFSSETSKLLKMELKYYFIEMIEYSNEAAARILVTDREPSADDFKSYWGWEANDDGMGLPAEYDPSQPGGPWQYNAKTGQHVSWSTTVRRSNPPHWASYAIQRGGELPLVVEFVFTDAVPINSLNETINVIDHPDRECRNAKTKKGDCDDAAHSNRGAALERGMKNDVLRLRMPPA